MTAVGRLLRTMRSARGMTIDETCADADIAMARLRQLERGIAVLGSLEGIGFAMALYLRTTGRQPHLPRRLLGVPRLPQGR